MGSHGGPKIVRDRLKLLLDGRDEGLRGGKSTLTDGSGNSNSGSMFTGACLNFDGSDDFITVPDSSAWDFGSKEFAIGGWIKFDSLGTQALIGQATPPLNDNFWYILFNTTNGFSFAWEWHDGSTKYGTIAFVGESQNAGAYSTNQWYHVAVTRNVNTYNLYVDGSLIQTNTSYSSSLNNNTGALGIGATFGWSTGSYVDGMMADWRIYHADISATDVSELYDNPNTVLPGNVSGSQLKAWWPMSEGSGIKAYDGSGGNNTGTLTNVPSHETAHRYIPQLAGKGLNKKMHFDGTNDYVNLGTTTDLRVANPTISCWINASAIENDVDIVSSAHGDGSNGYRFGINLSNSNSEVLWLIGNASAYDISYSSGLSHTVGAWRHVVGTYDGSNLKVYVDGSLSTTTSATKTITHAHSLHIGGRGADSQPSDNTWNGLIDEVAIWNVALDADAVSAIYNSGQPLDVRDNYLLYDEYTDNLVGYWRNTRTDWKDLSTNSNDGTVTGDPYWIKFPEGKTAGRDSSEMNLSESNSGVVDGTDYISVADSDDFHYGTDNFTIEMWAKRPTGAGSGGIYQQYVDDTNFQLIFYHSNNYLYIYNRVGGTATPYLNTSNALPLDTWHHLVFVRYGTGANNMYVYVDTVSQSITWNTGLSANADIPNLATDLWFGKAEPYGYGTWGGQLSSIKVYKGKALSTAEISQNYNMHKSRFK